MDRFEIQVTHIVYIIYNNLVHTHIEIIMAGGNEKGYKKREKYQRKKAATT